MPLIKTSAPFGALPAKAEGGGLAPAPWFVRNESRAMTGPIKSSVAGRTDHIPASVPSGSYVLPADHVSGLGQGNTSAGLNVLNKMFSSGPFGMAAPKMAGPMRRPATMRPPKALKFADGGDVPANDELVDIMAAGGEYIIPPEKVAEIGGGDINRGHEILDHWVVQTRKKHVKTLKKLPGPAQD